jgi:hypothetical protein
MGYVAQVHIPSGTMGCVADMTSGAHTQGYVADMTSVAHTQSMKAIEDIRKKTLKSPLLKLQP